VSNTTGSQISETPSRSEPALVPGRAKLAYAIMLLGVISLAATGILSFIVGNVPMTGWVLMLHVGSAPVFAIGLALVALTWSDLSRFCTDAPEQSCFAKAMLWLVLLSGFVVVMSGVVPMTPLFGTECQHTLYLTHRYSAFVLTAAVVLHLVSVSRKRS
jgi:hypothetical protein